MAAGPEDCPVNVTRFSHGQIVRGLHRLLHGPEPHGLARPWLRIAHGDGTESTPFPLRCLGPVPAWDVTKRPLWLGFVSGRHPEMDRVVDYYLVRNRELRLLECSADQEQEVYERALALLRELAAGEPCALEVYHTGLGLVTVGFYRAVVEAASAAEAGGRRIVLQPRVWAGGDVDLTRVLKEARGALDPQAVLSGLRTVVAGFPRYLALKEPEQVEAPDPIILRWLPERPMLPSEHDWLARRARSAAPVIAALRERAQYRCFEPWSTG